MIIYKRFASCVQAMYADLYDGVCRFSVFEKVCCGMRKDLKNRSKQVRILLSKPYMMDRLIECLDDLDLNTKNNIVYILCAIIEDEYGRHFVIAYPAILNEVFRKYRDARVGLHIGHVIKSCLQHRELVREIYKTGLWYTLLNCVTHDNCFELGASALMNVNELLHSFPDVTKEFLLQNDKNSMFFDKYSNMLNSTNYMICRLSLTYLYRLLSGSVEIRRLYVSDHANLKTITKLSMFRSQQIRCIALRLLTVD